MSKLDYCIRMQFRMIAGELAVTLLMLFMTVIFLFYGGFGGEGYRIMWAIGVPGLIVGILVSFSALRKLYVRSVYGTSSGLYQALPISASEQTISKTFTAGVFLILAFLPVFFIFGNGLGSYYVGRYRIRAAVTQILVNLGYVHSQVPLFAALAVVSAVLGCFAAAAAVHLVIVLVNQDHRDSGSRSRFTGIVETGFSLLALGIVAALNLLPYWILLASGGENGDGAMPHPAILPVAGILLNVGAMLAAGKGSVRLLDVL